MKLLKKPGQLSDGKFMNAFSFTSPKPVETIVFIGLLVIILLIPFDEGGNGYILQGLTQVLLLLCSTICAIQAIQRGTLVLVFSWCDLFVLGFLGWSLVSLAFSEYAYIGILEVIKMLSYVALFYLCRVLFPLENRQTVFLLIIVVSSMVQAMVAGYFYVTHHTPVLQASFVNPNNFASFVLFGIHIALGFVLFFDNHDHALNVRQVFFQKIVMSLVLGGLVIVLLAVRSRGAVISLVGTGLFLMTLRKKILGMLFLVLCVGVIFFPAPGGSLFHRLQKRDDPFAYERIGIWKRSIKMALDHPLVGVGPGMFKYYGALYNFPVEHQIARYGKNLNSAHNDLLQITSEVGGIGLLLFLGGIGWIGYYSQRYLRKHPPTWQIVAALAGILGVLIQGVFSNLLASPAIVVVIAILGVILLDGFKEYRQKTFTFAVSWRWYLALLVVFMYILVPVIGYPLLGHVHYLKFWELRQKQDIPKAVAHLKQAISYVPIHALYHRTLGNLYLTAFRNLPDLDAFYEGYAALSEAIRYNPRDTEAYISLAELHREMFYQKLRTKPTAQNALQAYRHVLRYNPFDPFSLFSMATLHADIEEFDQAIVMLRQAVEIEPNFVGGYQMLGDLLTHLQRHQEAQEAFRQVQHILTQYNADDQSSAYVKSLLRSIK
jgi:O-antigen ligase